MSDSIIMETLYSDISNYIPNNIKSYIIDIGRYEDSKYYETLNNKSYTKRNVCDHIHEEKLFYKNIYNDLVIYYKPLLKKYPFLQHNYNNLEQFITLRIN